MRSNKVIRTLLLSLVGTLLASNVSAQSNLTCPLAAQLFYKSVSIPWGIIGNSIFEVLNANCTDVITEGKSGKAMLKLDTKIVRTDRSLPGINFPPNTVVDPIKDQYVPVGSKFEISAEAKYALWDSGWKIESWAYKNVERVK